MSKSRLYIDEDAMGSALTRALRNRGVDVVSAYEAGMAGREDDEHFERALGEGRVLYTFNARDYFRIHTEYLSAGRNHAGLVLGQQRTYSTGEQMRRLLRLLAERSAESMCNHVEFLSNWG